MSRVRTALALLLWVTAVLGLPTLASARTSYVDSNGVRIAYEVIGDGEPLVLIPGFSQSLDAWKQTGHVDAFVSKGRKVILVDPRGHGSSDKPHNPGSYRLKPVADDVVAVLDALRIGEADLLGYSRGGWIAIATAVCHPERVRTVIAGGSHPYAEDLNLFRNAVGAGLEQWVGLIEGSAGPLSPEVRSMIMANDVEALRAAVADDRTDVSDPLAQTGVPVLLYAGSKDPRAELARNFASTTPTADFIELPTLNHFEAFFAVDPVVSFVKRTSKERPRRYCPNGSKADLMPNL